MTKEGSEDLAARIDTLGGRSGGLAVICQAIATSGAAI